MSRFFSIPGMAPSQSEGREDRAFATPDQVRGDPRYREFFASRKPTSHTTSGLDIGRDPTRANIMFRGDPARVVHEEYNQHSGELHTILARSSRLGSGTTRLTWKPDGDRRIVVADDRATTD